MNRPQQPWWKRIWQQQTYIPDESWDDGEMTTMPPPPPPGRRKRPPMDLLREAALWSLQHFEALDRANAQIHCAPVRYSPITFRLAMALRESWPQDEDITEEMANVLHHQGQYAEDPGR
jgi:hypothetical protein